MVDVGEDADGLIRSPYQAGAEKGRDEDDSVVELQVGASHVELIAIPVDVEKRRGEFVQDENWRVVVHKRPLAVY